MKYFLSSTLSSIPNEILSTLSSIPNEIFSFSLKCLQVILFREKVDQNCIRKLGSFQNPPPIVLQVLEMVMALLGRNKPLGNQGGEKSDKVPADDQSYMSGRMSTNSTPSVRSPTKTKFSSKCG